MNKKSEKRKFLRKTQFSNPVYSTITTKTTNDNVLEPTANRFRISYPLGPKKCSSGHIHFGAKINESHLKVIADRNLFWRIPPCSVFLLRKNGNFDGTKCHSWNFYLGKAIKVHMVCWLVTVAEALDFCR